MTTLSSISDFHIAKLQSTLNKASGTLDKFQKAFGYITGAISAVFFFAAWGASNKAKEAEAELKKIGPEQIVLPADMKPNDRISIDGEIVNISSIQPAAVPSKSL